MASESKSKSIKGCTRHAWNVSRVPIRLRLTRLGILAAMSLVLVGCRSIPVIDQSSPNDELVKQAIAMCTAKYDTKVTFSIIASYERLRKEGKLQLEAAREAGSDFFEHFTDDKERSEVYKSYINCIKPFVEKLLREDQRPTVVLVGSTEDYTTYNLAGLEATSVELLHRRLGEFKIIPITVSYGWYNESLIRSMNPSVIVMHASAFHHDKYKDKAIDKFQAIVESLYSSLPKTRFVIFSRLPWENPAPDLCQRWNRQVKFLTAKRFQDRLVFYPLHREDSDFTGKAGTEISHIVRCLSGLEATEYSSFYLRQRREEARKRIRQSRCR